MPNECEKLKGDIAAAASLLKTWEKDPAAIFVKYGVAKKKEDVKLSLKRTEEDGRKIGKGWCCCGCAFTCELQFEKD
jgi:hypothetical protein